MGSDFPEGELNQGYGDLCIVVRHKNIDENPGKCTEQVLQLEAKLCAMP